MPKFVPNSDQVRSSSVWIPPKCGVVARVWPFRHEIGGHCSGTIVDPRTAGRCARIPSASANAIARYFGPSHAGKTHFRASPRKETPLRDELGRRHACSGDYPKRHTLHNLGSMPARPPPMQRTQNTEMSRVVFAPSRSLPTAPAKSGVDASEGSETQPGETGRQNGWPRRPTWNTLRYSISVPE